MDIFVLRHGIAEEHSKTGRDSDRALTAEGIDKIRRSAQALHAIDLSIDFIISSPYARARETAGIVATVLKHKGAIEFTEDLVPHASPDAILPMLRLKRAKSVLLVGHEPHLSSFISLLLAGRNDLHIAMKKGGFARLHCASGIKPGGASLEWLLAPKHLTRME